MNLKTLEKSKPVRFNYPLTNTPNLLVKLGVKVDHGIGPDNDIVAYSGICQHLGCYYDFLPLGSSPPCNSAYAATESVGYCCCHGSQYDLTHNGKVIGGPAPYPLPRVILELEKSSGDIYAVGMGPPTIYGHGPRGTIDSKLVLRYDMEGGKVVS
jgi:arsenite oxidase small subunit